MDTDFHEYARGKLPVQCGALSAVKLPALSFAEALNGDLDHRYLAYELVDENGAVLCKKAVLFEKPKHFAWKKPEISAVFSEKDGKTAITLSSDTFAKGVCLSFGNADVVLSDNYFDLTDGGSIIVTVEKIIAGNADMTSLQNSLQICSVYDIAK